MFAAHNKTIKRYTTSAQTIQGRIASVNSRETFEQPAI